MPFVKGKSGNPAGRPKGSRSNKQTITQVLNEQGEHLGPILNRLREESPKEYILAVVALAKLVLELRGNEK